MRVGGSFVYPPSNPVQHDSLLLLAGGVGLNPMLSILTWLAQDPTRRSHLKRIQLLYASKRDELAFADRLTRLREVVETTLYLSAGSASTRSPAALPFKVHERRMRDDEVLACVGDVRQHQQLPLVYICGPTEMTDHFEALLARTNSEGGAGLSQSRIQLEKWW